MDYGAVNNYSETLCNVITTIVQAQMQQMQCDKTIKCVIKDDKLADYNCYLVSDGSSEYNAYSIKNESYKNGDSVFVTIPNGNYSEQKFIIGQNYNNNLFFKPFNDFVSVASISRSVNIGLVANGGDKEREIGGDLFPIQTRNDPLGNSDITHLIISANFSTFLPTCQTGSFGLKIVLSYETQQGVPDDYTTYFMSSNMYGNIYQLNESTQNYVLKLEQLNIAKITKLSISLYQQQDFFDSAKKYLSASTTSNIALNHITVEAGYSKEVLTKDCIIVSANFDKTYATNDDELGPIGWVFVVKDSNEKWRRVLPHNLLNVYGRTLGFEVLEYDSKYVASKNAEIETDLWRLINATESHGIIQSLKGNINQNWVGIQIVLYEQFQDGKRVLAREKILFQKREGVVKNE